MASMVHHRQSRGMFQAKWGTEPERWQPGYMNVEQRLPSFILYPYFESDIETLDEQRYMRFG